MTSTNSGTPLHEQGTISVEQAAGLLGVRPRTVYAWTRDGRLPAVRIGRTVRVQAAPLARMIGADQ